MLSMYRFGVIFALFNYLYAFKVLNIDEDKFEGQELFTDSIGPSIMCFFVTLFNKSFNYLAIMDNDFYILSGMKMMNLKNFNYVTTIIYCKKLFISIFTSIL